MAGICLGKEPFQFFRYTARPIRARTGRRSRREITLPKSVHEEWLIWRIATATYFRETFREVAAWPLPRTIAANELIDVLDEAQWQEP